jgi:hypothetical protein
MTTRRQLATVFGVSERRIAQLEEDQLVQRDDSGYDLEESARRYIAHLKRDDALKASRRALMDAQTKQRIQATRRAARELVTFEEHRDEVLQVWGACWTSAVGAVSRLHARLGWEPGLTATQMHSICSFADADLKSYLRQARDQALARMAAAPEARGAAAEVEYERQLEALQDEVAAIESKMPPEAVADLRRNHDGDDR